MKSLGRKSDFGCMAETSGSGRPIVLQFRQRVGVHIAGEAVRSEL